MDGLRKGLPEVNGSVVNSVITTVGESNLKSGRVALL